MSGARSWPMRVWRKLTTRPVWWWQKHRPYPVRAQIDRLPVQRWRSSERIAVTVLTTPATLTNALWTAYGFGRRLADVAGLSLVIDGRWSDTNRQRVERLLPGVILREAAQEVDTLGGHLPALRKFAEVHPLGRKLAATLAAQQRGHVLFTDDDVLAFGALADLGDAFNCGVPVNRYLREEAGRMQCAPAVMASATRLGMTWREDLNDGLLLLRRNSLEADRAERLLATTSGAPSWFTGTVTMSVLLAASEARALPPDYLVSTAGQFYFQTRPSMAAIEVRHYVSPVRHLMYAEGLPRLLAALESTREQA